MRLGRDGSSSKHWLRALALLCFATLTVYLLAAYEVIPAVWKSYESRHPALALAQKRAFTLQGIPGDPINLAFVGQEDDLIAAAVRSGWLAADPITWKSSAKITIDSLAHRAYGNAPVSDLYVEGKKQDLAFEQAFGPDPSKRHHARFWKSEQVDDEGRPLWLGAATFDSRVGVSHLTGQVTHHIDADVDKERNKLAADFGGSTGIMLEWIEGFQHDLRGKNGGGDPYFTDGRLCLIYLAQGGLVETARSTANSAVDWVTTALK